MANTNEDINSQVVITVLDFPDNVRESPEIYLDGPNHCLYEIVDNSVDEHKAGYCTVINVMINQQNVGMVQDNGRGIPVDLDPRGTGFTQAETALSTLSAGGKFAGKEKSYTAETGGKNGVGSSCVNAVSDFFQADIFTGGAQHQIRFKQGRFTQRQIKVKDIDANVHGTTIMFHLDKDIYEENHFDLPAIERRLRQTAFLNPGLTLNFTYYNESKELVQRTYKYDNGLADYLDFLSKTKQLSIPEKIFLSKVIEDPKLGRPITFQVAFTYADSYNQDVKGFVNSIASEDGGDHINGFNAGICKAVRTYAVEQKAIKQPGDFETTDTYEGILGIISVSIKKPTFGGQNKRKLDMPAVKGIVANAVYDEFYNFLCKNPKAAEVIIEKALRACKERLSIKRAKDAARGLKKTNAKTVTLGKLANCSSNKPEECEIYFVEGDSAGGSAKQARDIVTQAILPIFGKILNCEKKREDQIVNNEKLGLVVAALECGFGETFDISKLRYHKIILFSDADPDGGHIVCLYIAFFYRHYPELVKNGHLYVACPPLFKASKKGQPDRYFYNFAELQAADTQGCSIQRYKGLGEMNPDQLWDTTMNPATRRLERVTIEDAEAAQSSIEVCMGANTQARKDFIFENAVFA